MRLRQVEYFKHKSSDQFISVGRYLSYEITAKVAQRFICKFRANP